MPVIFSDFLVSNEMSGYTENNSTTIFIVHELFLSCKLFKVYRNNMDHPVRMETLKMTLELDLTSTHHYSLPSYQVEYGT